MTEYSKLLAVVRQQLELAERGEVETAISLMDERQHVLISAPEATAADAPLIQEVLQLDRQIAGHIRQRMLRIREDALALQRGQTALRGYGSFKPVRGDRLNFDR